MLFYGSAEHTADSLKKHGTGFDLIVGAQELAGASERTVDGRRLPPAPLPLYKTSALRMQEALAVSYRRQAEKVKLAEGARAGNDKLKRTLLSRMMAVYATAGHHVVPEVMRATPHQAFMMKFVELERVHTQGPADTLRALYPLLSHC
eukprot:jgi/Tetstr1/449826/TSEL_036889.t1